MRSLKFPNMLQSNTTNVWKASEYLEQTKQNTTILLHCEKGELFGDPYFGLAIKRFLFNQNSAVVRDQFIDQIYTQVSLFIPQVKIERKDIQIVQDKERGMLYCNFIGINQINYQVDTYQLILYKEN